MLTPYIMDYCVYFELCSFFTRGTREIDILNSGNLGTNAFQMYVIELKRKEVRNEGLKLEIIYYESWVEEKRESQDKSVQ